MKKKGIGRIWDFLKEGLGDFWLLVIFQVLFTCDTAVQPV